MGNGTKWIIGVVIGFFATICGFLVVMAGATGGGHW